MNRNSSMDEQAFTETIDEVIAGLPEEIRNALDNIEILVSEEADEYLDPEGQGLLGLYLGVPLTERSANHAGELPDVIHIFRRPHLALDLPEQELKEEIARTVMHEIGHYFGLDDDHLEEIGWD